MNTSVMLATSDRDLGLVPTNTATARAQAEANKSGKPVTVRSPTTDKVIRTVKPKKPAAKGKAKRGAR